MLLDADGKVKASYKMKSLSGDPKWAAVFTAAGLPTEYEAQMALWLRCHAPVSIAFESASVLAVKRNGGASWGEAMTTARGTQECYVLLKRMGYKIYTSGERGAGLWQYRGVHECH